MFRRNVIANFFGRSWPNILAFLFVPIYIRYLGIEAYGLIGFFTSLQAMVSFFDLGLSTIANREVAIRWGQPHLVNEVRKIVRTLEIIYVVAAIFIGVLFVLASNWLSTHWITAEGLSGQTIKLAVIIFGVTLALRWPVTLYASVMLGLEKQAWYNVLTILISTLRSVGAVLAITLWSPTILTFLLWHLGSAIIEILLMAYTTWYLLPKLQAERLVKFDLNIIKGLWRLSVLLSINSMIAAVIKQADRVILSGLVSLQSVGYYSTAYSAYFGMGLLQIPISDASFPRFSRLIAENKIDELADIYHKSCQYLSFISAPVASFVFYFSYEILLIWTQSVDIAKNTAIPLSLLAVAYIFNTMVNLLWRLQLAHGVAWLMVVSNAIALLLLLPTMYVLVGKYGINGAGAGWLIINLMYYFLMPHWMHKRILPTHKWRWYFYDTSFFLLLSWFMFGIAYIVNKTWHNILFTIFALGISSFIYIISCYKLYPSIRFFLLDSFQKTFRSV